MSVIELKRRRPQPEPKPKSASRRPHLMHQTWRDLLFAHWPIPVETIRPLVPYELPVDSFDGTAWVGVVPFRMTGIRLRGLPPFPFASAFPELNVRTYVTYKGKPGVYFFSLDAAHRLAVWAARTFVHLPYRYAVMPVTREGERIDYRSERRDALGRPAVFDASYRPLSEPYRSERGSLEYWLTERYCLYTLDREGNVLRGDIWHEPWLLQRAEAELRRSTMAEAAGIVLPDTAPLLHYAERQDVLIWPNVKA